MNNYVIEESNEAEAASIINELVNYNLSIVPQIQEEPFIWINKVIKNSENKIVAGINSKMYCWNCLFIDSLWVSDDFRRHGLATKLLNVVEKEAVKKGCKIIHLDTFDFQAKDFYIKQGYEVFGILENCPENHKRYYMKKNLI